MKALVFLIVVSSYYSISSQNTLIPIHENHKWGFINDQKVIVIQANFDSVSIFQNDKALVKRNSKYGVINIKGEYVIKPKFKKIEALISGYVAIKGNNKKVLFNSQGKKVKTILNSSGCGNLTTQFLQKERYSIKSENKIALIYNKIVSNNKGDPKVVKDTTQYIYSKISNFGYSSFIIEHEGKFGIWCPSEMGVDINFKYQGLSINSLNSKNPSYYKFKENGKWGLINTYLDVIIKPKYDEIYEVDYTYLKLPHLVKVKIDENKYGYVDLKGNEYY